MAKPTPLLVDGVPIVLGKDLAEKEAIEPVPELFIEM